MQCYFEYEKNENGERIRCEKEAYKDSCWCSRTHQLAWQNENYGSTAERKMPKTVEDLQEKILAMRKNRQGKIL